MASDVATFNGKKLKPVNNYLLLLIRGCSYTPGKDQ